MIYRRVECPHCGNDIGVSDAKETHKCRWCRRLISVKFIGKGKKARCEVEATDFPEENVQNKKIKNYSKWKEEDVYGCFRN